MPPPTPWSVAVHLTDGNVAKARRTGAARQGFAESNGLRPTYGIDPRQGLPSHIAGAAAELAVAQLAGCEFDPNIGGDFRAPDVGDWDVRSSARIYGHLILHPRDIAERVHIRVVGVIPDFWVVGWIYGFDAMRPEFWKDPTGHRPAYFFPQARLLPWPPPPARFHYERKEAA